MENSLISTIRILKVPKVILRYIMMNFLDLLTIKNLLLTVKEMNVLDDYSKDLLEKSKNGFSWSCENGHLAVAKWLLRLGTTCSHPTCPSGTRYVLGDVNIHANDEYAFRYSCENGHLATAKWLYCLSGVNIHANDEWAFGCSCANGHLDVAKWLYSLGGINIHADGEYAFGCSCENGHLDVAKWLYSLGGVNIHARNEWAFRWSSGNVLEWLNMIKN